MIEIIGIDPGLQRTGWGVIRSNGSRNELIAHGVISTKAKEPTPLRLLYIHQQLKDIIEKYRPKVAAIEETYVNKNYQSSLVLSQARGVALMTLAMHGLVPYEYHATMVKKTIVGTGTASKEQIIAMLPHLLPGITISATDSADALAVAICCAHRYTYS